MDHQALEVAHEFAVYENLFDHILLTQDCGEANYQASPEESVLANLRQEKMRSLLALFTEAVARAELKVTDMERLIDFGESFISETEKLLHRLSGT